MEPVELQTDRLVLRAVTAADEAAIVEACNDPEIAYYLPLPVPYTSDDARNFIAKSAQDWVDGNRYGFGFFVAETGELVGTCSLMSVTPGVLEVGYWSTSRYRRKGLTAEAVRRLCQWGFEALGAHRIEWWAVVGNEGSRAVAEAAGFEMEGLLRRRSYRREEPADWWVGGLLPPLG
ncbi:GNAT family N-acetyltransferase [Mycobacteroides franklinii]|uniref:Putative ribosomal N-acetyltransferase YdaF n=1 Tax=Mycobacteroides franklinii TaxID=948102 RepID=A0A4R8R642_9MYCO|nr:GNAT family N-acetyltransferase [Mycobacteroides franklinii]TDZ44291.1 putative ribosomal N-acetyltransferase YdaF [Mycobacteroides franklinii]TDZ51424.1 putative ribosomal N-acetyltransferase YdaF [Mycobacteroides franklinii]TDZ57845.1 putative ribosomal N-acetyltransferase YdaF [Mycobacteroides franklinii]TDZ64786.1 putative ribosomal N-acetyltransferase YdaF [Mycobacteroides franklinii]TDZ71184.1 putative ribosomal N-acetyltransferase YdaF [Mycobacteroides franklinii]